MKYIFFPIIVIIVLLFLVLISPFIAFVLPFKFYFDYRTRIHPNYRNESSVNTIMELGKVFLTDLNKQNGKI